MLRFYNENRGREGTFRCEEFFKTYWNAGTSRKQRTKKKKNTKSELGDTLKHFKTNRTKTGEESKVSLLCFSNYVNFE